MPTCVGLRYGHTMFSLEAFLGGLGTNDFRLLAQTRVCCHALVQGIFLPYALHTPNRSCPIERLTFPTASPPCAFSNSCGAGLSNLLAIAYDYNVLGLGPDSPWDD